MKEADNSLEQGYEGSTYDSSLESQATSQYPVTAGANTVRPPSLFRYNKMSFLITAIALTVIIIITVLSLLLTGFQKNKSTSQSSAQKVASYAVGSLSSNSLTSGSKLNLGEADHLAINGQLQVSNTLVLSPTATPTSPTAGQIYYDKSTNQPYYYNGSQFVSMSPAAVPEHITSLGGIAGVIGLGDGLNISGNQLSVSNSLLQAVANAGLSGTRVNSLQGLTGDVTLAAGPGIGISGTTISNNGVITLAGGGNIIVTNNGGGSYTVSENSGSGTVNLGPASPQVDAGSNSSININKTGSGNLLELANSGVDVFVVNQTGRITTGTIDFSQVQNVPTFVSSIGGASGAVTLGTGLSVVGSTLSNSGVTGLSGTANQISVSAATGNIILSLPQNIGTASTPTFGGLTLGSALTVANGGTGVGSFTANGIVYGNGAGALQVTGTAANSILATNGGSVPGLTQTLPTAVQGNITSTGVLASGSIASGFGTISTTNNISTTALLQSGSLSVASGNFAVDGSGNLTAAASGTFNSNLAVRGGSLTVGVAGSTAGNLLLANNTSSRLVDLQGLNPSGVGNSTVQIPSIAGGSTDTVCLLSLANCVGTGGSISGSGTLNSIPVFTGTNSIGNSAITDNGVNVTVVGEGLVAGTITAATLQSAGTLAITPGGALTVGATNQQFTLQGNGSSTIQISSGGNKTTLGFVAPTANRTISLPDETGTVCLQGSVNCGFAVSGSGVTSLNTSTGVITLANASTGGGSTITINNAAADGATKGIATFNSTNFTASGGVINTIQGISTVAAVQFGSIGIGIAPTGVSGDLNLLPAGTLYTDTIKTTATGSGNLSIYSDGVGSDITFVTSGGANSFTFPSTGGTGQIICTSGISCASGGGQAVILEPGTGGGTRQDASANRPAIWVNKASGTGDLIELQAGGVDAFTIDNTGNTTITAGGVTNGFTIGGALGVNTITPSGALTIGATGQSFTLQGNGSSALTATGGGALTTVNFNIGSGGTAPNGNVTYQFENDNTVAAGTYTICTTSGNCTGVGGGITGSGTAGKIAKFSAPGNIVDSILADNGTTVTVGGNLAVGTSGASQLSIGVGSSAKGSLVLYNSTDAFKATLQRVATTPGADITINVPNQSGTLAVSATGPLSLDATTGALSCSTCLTSGGGGSGGVSSIIGTAGGSVAINGALTLNNSGTTGTTITIDNALADGSTKGIAAFNSTNFTSTGGVINTIQDIATGSSPTFANLSLQGATGLTIGSATNLGKLAFKDGTADGFTSTFSPATLGSNQTITIPNASGTLAVSASGNLSLSALGALTFSNSPTFSGTLAVQGSGGITVGVAGSTTGNLNLANSSSSRLVDLQGLNPSGSGNATVQIPTIAGGSTDTVCLLTLANCVGAGGSVTTSGGTQNYLTKYSNGAATQIGNSQLFDNGSGVSIGNATPAGLFNVGATNQFQVSSAGAVTAVGVDSGTGLLQGSGGLTLTGATSINASGTANTSIGNATGTFGLASSGLNVTTAGALSGITTINASGAITAATSSNTINGLVINSGALSAVTGITFTSGNFDQSASGGTFKTGTGAATLNGDTTVSGSHTLNVGTGATTLGGTLGVTGLGTFNGGLTVVTGSTFTNASSTLLSSVAIANHAGGGNIGTAAATVDVATTFDVTQTTAGQTLTLPNPTTTTSGRIVYINSLSGNAAFTMYGVNIAASSSASFIWNGTAWIATSTGGSGVNSVGTIDSQTKNANGAVISGSTLYLQTADASNVGLVSTGAQTFGGLKTFNSGLTAAGGTILLNDSSNNSTSINTGSSTGSVSIGNSLAGAIALQSASTINLTAGAASTWSTGANSLTVISSNFNVASGGAVTAGTYNGQTISSAANFTGTLAVQGAGGITVGSATNIGQLKLTDGTADGFLGTLQLAGVIGSNQSYLLPTTGGTLCTTATCAGSSGGTGYIQNTTAVQTSANFYIRSAAIGSVGGIIEGANGQTADLLRLNTFNGTTSTTVAKFDNVGNLTAVGGTFTSTLAGVDGTFSSNLTVQGSGGVTVGTTAAPGLLVLNDGNGGSNKTATLQAFATLGQNTVFTLPDPGTSTATVCVLNASSVGNCAGLGGSVATTATGSGNLNYVTKFSNTTGTTIVNSQVYDNASFVGINTTTDSGRLSVVSTTTGESGLYVQANVSSATVPVAVIQGGATPGAGADLLDLKSSAALVTKFDNAGNLQFQQASTVNIASAATGTQLTVQGGAATTGTNVGGNLLLQGGAGASTGASGSVIVKSNTNNSTTAFQVQNTSGASGALLTGDTSNMRLGVDVTYASMTSPTQNNTSTSTTGGTLAATTYYYKVTAIDSAGGETTPSAEKSQVTTGATSTVTVAWVPVSGATGYKIYRGTTALGGSGSEVYLTTTLGTVNGGNLNYVDTGSIAAGAATPPASNTAYISTNVTNNNLQLSVGGNGTPTGQVYVGGTVPTAAIGSMTVGSNPQYAFVQGRYAYVVNKSGNTLQAVDVSNPASPVSISTVATGASTNPNYVYVQGRYAYVTDGGNATLQIFDVSNPASMSSVGTVSTGNTPTSVYVQGRYAYVANKTGNSFQIIDVSNPSSPSVVSTVTTGSGPVSVYVQGRYAYVTNTTSATLQIIDVSNPANPAIMSTFTVGASPQSVYVQGRYAYIVESGIYTLQIVDISNPGTPVSLSSTVVTSGLSLKSVYVQGRYAYIVNSYPGVSGAGFDIMDVSNPVTPVKVGTSLTTSATFSPNSVYVQGRYAYVIDSGGNSLQILDLGGTYDQQLQAGGAEVGTLQVDTNAIIGGDGSIQGGLSLGANLQVAGSASINGNLNLTATTISAPTAPTLTSSGVGGTLAAATYSYQLAAITANGTSAAVASSPSNVVDSGSTSKNTLTWSAVTGATGYIVYESTNGTTWFSNEVSSNTLSIVDNGTNFTWTNQVTPPAAATTGGNLTVGGTALFQNAVNSTTAFQVQNAAGNMLLGVDTTTAAPINYIGVTGATALAGTVHIADTSGAAQAVTIGSTFAGSTTTLQGNTGISLNSGTVNIGNAGGTLNLNTSTVTFNQTSSIGTIPVGSAITGLGLTLQAGAGFGSGTGSNGGQLTLSGGNAGGSGVNAGGNLLLQGGAKTSTGAPGTVLVKPQASNDSSTAFQVQNSTGTSLLAADTSNLRINIGALGTNTPTGQLYVSGSVASAVLSSTTITATPASVYTQGNYAYVADSNASTGNILDIYDVSSPASPVSIGGFTSNNDAAASVYVQGRYAYLIDTNGSNVSTLRIIDISNPASPTQIGSVPITSTGTEALFQVIVQGRYAYVVFKDKTANTGDLAVFNISNPASPVQVGSDVNTGVSGAGAVGMGLYVQGHYAYITNRNAVTLSVYDIATPANPIALGSISTSTNSVTQPSSVYVQGRYAYVTGLNSNKLAIYDISNPNSLAFVSSVNTGANAATVYVQDRYAYVTQPSNNTLGIYDVSNASSIASVGTVPVGAGATMDWVYASGRYAYVTSANSGSSNLFTVDLGGTYTQQLEAGGVVAGTFQTLGNATVNGDTAIAGGITVGANTQLGGDVGVNGALSVASNINYVGGADITGTTNAGTGNADINSVFVSGRYEYVATASNSGTCGQTATNAIGCELQVYDVSNPASPTYIGGATSAGSTNSGSGSAVFNSVFVSGRFAFLTKGGSATACSQVPGSAIGCELQVYDISNPSTPTYFGGADASGSTNSGTGNSSFNSAFVSGRYVYVAKSGSATNCSQSIGSAIGCELQVYDIANPSTPTYVGAADANGSTNTGTGNNTFNSVYVQGRYAYVVTAGNATACSQTAGSAIGCELQVYDISTSSNPGYVGGADASGATNSNTGSSTFNSIYISGRYAYVAKGGSGTACTQSTSGTGAIGCELQDYDISNPTAPTFVGGADISGSTNSGSSNAAANTVYGSGRYVYLGIAGSATACAQAPGSAIGCELQSYDVANPAAPTYLGGADVSGSTNSGTGSSNLTALFVAGNDVYEGKGGSATACSQTPGSAIGCELQSYSLGGIESVSVLAHSLEGGSLQVDNNASVAGQLTVSGSVNIGSGLNVQNDLAATGTVLFKSKTNSAIAFRVQNATGTNLIAANANTNLVSFNGGSAASAGAELFTAAESFSAGSGWTTNGLTGSSATITHTAAGGTTAISPAPALTITAGNSYQVSFTITGSPTAGETVTPSIGGASGMPITGNDAAEVQIISATTTGNLAFTPTNNWNGTVSNISVKLITVATAAVSIQGNPFLGAGNLNVFYGSGAGLNDTGGTLNTGIGSGALGGNTAGGNNAAFGNAALLANTTGNNSTGLGAGALQANTTGGNNVGIGYQAGYTGTAANANTTGSNNTFIGYNSGPGTSTQLQNATAIGTYAVVNQSNSLVLGCINGVNGCTATTSVGIGTSSPGNLLSIGALTTAQAGYQIAVSTGAATNSGIVVQTVAGQSAGNILQAQDSTGAALATIDYQGNLTVKAATINGTLTVNGHIITGSAAPTSPTAQASAGTGATCSVSSGNDTSGTITVVTGAGVTTGTWCTFTVSFGAAPRPVVSGFDQASAALLPFMSSTSTTFTFGIAGGTPAATTYKFNYFNVQ